MISPTNSSLLVPFIPAQGPRVVAKHQLLDLPIDLIYDILLPLGLENTAACSQVCKNFFQITQSENLWGKLFTRDFLPQHPTEDLSIGFRNVYKNCHRFHANLVNGVFSSEVWTGSRELQGPIAVADGRLFSRAGGDDNTIYVWDVETGECLKTLAGHEVSSLAFGNGQLFSGSLDNTIKVWNIEIEKCLKTLKGHRSCVSSLAFGNGQLFSGSLDNTIKVWNIETGECLKTLQYQNPVHSLAFGNDQLFSCSSFDWEIKIWDVEKGECFNALEEHKHSVDFLTYVHGKLFSFSRCDGEMKIWNAETGQCLNTLREVFPPFFSANGQRFSLIISGVIMISDFKADHHAVFEEIVYLFETDRDDIAMQKFNKMPRREKSQVYGALYHILKPFKNDYWGCAEHAFHDQHGLNSTPKQKAQAIKNYLNSGK